MLKLSNHQVSLFLTCHRKYQLKSLQKWTPIDTKPALLIGRAVHAALATLAATNDEAKVMQAALAELGEPFHNEEIVDQVFLLIDGYQRQYERDWLSPITSETTIVASLTKQLKYEARIDGLVENSEGVWVKEIKTSGAAPGSFFKQFEYDRQTTGYVWACREAYPEMEIKGVVIDAIFKPSHKTPEPKYEREYIEIPLSKIQEWKKNTLEIAKEIKRCLKSKVWYGTDLCLLHYGQCEFWEYCSNGQDKRILGTTHIKKRREK